MCNVQTISQISLKNHKDDLGFEVIEFPKVELEKVPRVEYELYEALGEEEKNPDEEPLFTVDCLPIAEVIASVLTFLLMMMLLPVFFPAPNTNQPPTATGEVSNEISITQSDVNSDLSVSTS